METIQPKKLLILFILDILEKYTDSEHTLTQNEIQEILAKEYNMNVDRKSVKRNLMNLAAINDNIQYTEIERINTTIKDNQKITSEETICTDWYIDHIFDESELHLLIESLLFSRHISNAQCKNLISKLEGLANKYFKSKVKYVSLPPVDKTDNQQIFYTISMLDAAISSGKKISFYYCDYGIDKKLHRRKRDDGTAREYICSPYHIAVNGGKYFLICNYDKYDNISNYRIDRIRDIKILEENAKPVESLNGINGRFDIKEYMKTHIYMFAGNDINVKFRIPKKYVYYVFDFFGKDVTFTDETETHICVSTRVNEHAMEQFAKAYAPYVIVLSPQSLVDSVIADLQKAIDEYENDK